MSRRPSQFALAAVVAALVVGVVALGVARGLLTMVVSLEAIFLATFVMVTQNRQGRRADIRSQLDFETNLRSEIWSVHIGQALGIDLDHVEGVVRRAIESTRAQLEDGAPEVAKR